MLQIVSYEVSSRVRMVYGGVEKRIILKRSLVTYHKRVDNIQITQNAVER
jgi:hypothetical protein